MNRSFGTAPSRRRSSSALPAAPTVGHFRRAALAVAALAVYGSLIPLNFTPRPLADAVAAFRQMPLFDPADLAASGIGAWSARATSAPSPAADDNQLVTAAS